MDTPVQIRLFGAFAVSVGDTSVPEGAWRLRKGKSLVKLLALSPERRVHRDRATELLWPDRASEAASNNFHQALYVARRALESAGADASTVLPLRDDMLLLSPETDVHVDVDAFEAAAARARDTGEPSDYRAALDLHAGELLPEDRFEAWAADRREALNETHLALLLELAERLGESGDGAAAIELLEQAVVLDPLLEPAHRALMRLFAAAGRRQQALAQYQRLRAALKRELEADPDPQTASLYRTLLRGETDTAAVPAPAPAPAGPPAPRPPRAAARHNLPTALTSFVGRDREMADVARLLDRNRLLTLTGAGGAGKTRLALEAARRRVPHHPDGVWLVELAGLGDPALVPEATATAIGLTLPSQRRDVDELSAHLAEKDALLILDNCEHLIAACAGLAGQLLASCPSLSVLATSREPLRVPGEVTWRVPSLTLPDVQAAAAMPLELASSESVVLFCERASDVAPGFGLNEENAAAVAEICLRLDGMPLALELAAARVASLSPAQIAERLNDSLAVLTAGSRAGLDRQQTLRATLSWSHDLLTDDERTQFRRLAVFAGTFALEGAEAVTAGGCVEPREVADLLGRLVDKSLVVAEDVAGGYRYRLLESMRQYAFERLGEAGEAAELEARHYDHYLALAMAADPECAPPGVTVRPERLGVDHDNLRAALAWALRRDPQKALRLAVYMWPMWMAGSHYQEGDRLLNAALAAAPEPTVIRTEALRAASALQIRLGRVDQLRALSIERVEIFQKLGDRHEVAHALDEVGVFEYMAGHYVRAASLYAESLALAEELHDGKAAAAVLHSAAVLDQCRANFTTAREALLDSLRRLRAIPASDSAPFFRVHTVGLFVAAAPPGAAPRMYFEETLQLFRRVNATSAVGYVLAALGDVARAQGLTEPARERLTESLAHFRDAGDAMGTAFALNRLGNLAGAIGEHDLAREWLEEGLELRRDLGDRRAVGITLGNLGVLAARAGDPARGRATVRQALSLFEEDDDLPGQMGMRLSLGHIAADAGDIEQAREMLESSRDLAEQQLLFRCSGWATLRLAELAIAGGEFDRASELVDVALGHLRPLGDLWGVSRGLELDQSAAKRSLSPAGEG